VPTDPRKQFGRNLCRIRTALPMTQETLAEKADISVRYIQKIEAGEPLPSVATLAQLHKALGCSLEDLMRGL